MKLSILMSLFISINFAFASISPEVLKAANQAGAKAATVVTFLKNSSSLDDNAKNEIRSFIADAGKQGAIKYVKIAAWSDQEYPAKSPSLSNDQVDLARQRGQSVLSYLKLTLNLTHVSALNMAKRPDRVQGMIPTPNSKIKNALETYGAAPTVLGRTESDAVKGKTSQALVLVYYK